MATALARIVPAPSDAAADLDAYLAANGAKSMLRLLTCGSVDDGKSTLIGRLLYDSKMLFEDQLATLETDSRKSGTQGEALDLALLVDGLAAEREQGITIDVAYRYFATDKRKFIVADTPGHEQYTRNMVTGASTADLAVILVDARKGILTQTRRHSHLVHLLGIRRLVLAVNKMDLVGHNRARFDGIVADYRAFADSAGIGEVIAIPVSGLSGDNVASPTTAMPWYGGPSLLGHLETVEVSDPTDASAPFRMAVQWVNRPGPAFRGYAGTVSSGTVRPGDRVAVHPSGAASRVDRIVAWGGDLDVAAAGRSVTLTLTDEIDCSRGDLLASADAPAELATALDATLVWMAEEALVPNRAYLLKVGTRTLSATVAVVEVMDVETGARGDGRTLHLNDIGACRIDLDRAISAVPYGEDRHLGGFILIDKVSNATVAAGMVRSARRGGSEQWPPPGRVGGCCGRRVPRPPRGPPSRAASAHAWKRGHLVLILDEAGLRDGLNVDLGTSSTDAAEKRRRAREVGRLIERTGVHVVLDLEASAAEAYPGRAVGHDDDEEQWLQDWTI